MRPVQKIWATCLPAFIAFAIFGTVTFGTAISSNASEMPKASILDILAVVNEYPVSAYDLNQRLDLIIRSSTLPNTPRARLSLAPRVLKSLINEALQLQEAKRLKVVVSQPEMNRALRLVEKQNRLQANKILPFLKSRQIGQATLLRQIRAALAWQVVVRRRYAHSTIITDEEIDRTLARFKKNAKSPRLQAAEIFLPLDNPSQETTVRNTANKIIEEIKAGANFALLARQFSQSESARHGGDLGWIQPGQLDPQIDEVLKTLPIKALSKPIRTAAGYTIVLLRNRRAPPEQKAGNTIVGLRQIILEAPNGAQNDELQSQLSLADTIQKSVRGCDDFAAIAKELGIKRSGNIIRVKIKELSKNLRTLVSTIKTGAVSPPLRSPEGLKMIMVCNRSNSGGGGANLPNRNKIRTLLLGRRLEIQAQRYLRDLRQTAFLDIRAWR